MAEVDGEDERAPVAGDQLGAGAAVAQRVDDVADVLDPGDLAAEPVDLAPHGGAREVEAPAARSADEQHDPGVRVVAERVAEQAVGLLALRGGVGEAGRLQVVLDVFAEGDRDEREGADRREDELRVLPGEVGDRGSNTGGDRTRFQSSALKNKSTLLRSAHGTPRIRPAVQPRLRPRPDRRALVAADRPRADARPAALLGARRARSAARPPTSSPSACATSRRAGVVRRGELEPPASGAAYELTDARPRARAAAARAGALGPQLPRPADVAEIAAGDRCRTPCGSSCARRRTRADDRPAHRRARLPAAGRGRLGSRRAAGPPRTPT